MAPDQDSPDAQDMLLSTGRPVFRDASLVAQADGDSNSRAWKSVFTGAPDSALAGVHGDFAAALRAPDGSTHFVVDRFAVRSLCYRIDDGRLRLSSRAADLAGASPDLNPQAIFDYLYHHVIPSPETIFSGVMRLPPAHRARFANGKLEVAQYWKPRFEENRPADFSGLRDEFRQLLADAVQEQLAGQRVGCFLSGGTDSSTVSGMLGKATGEPAHTFSIGFEAEGYDEMEYSRIAARHFKTDHHEYYVTPADLVRSVPDVAASFDQPFGNSSVVPAYYCARMARDSGIERMLGGDGGDELFGGNTRYAKQRVFGVYDHVPPTLRRMVMEPLLADNPLANALPVVRKAASYVRQARVPMPDRMETYNLLDRLGMEEVLSADFLARIDRQGPAKQQREVYRECQAGSLVNRMLAYDWRYTLGETDLPKVVGATALAGVSVGFPFLDQRLVDFSLGLPAHYKVKGLRLRWFFKEALRGFLPDEIITKKKQGFGLPFGVWATRDQALNAMAADSLRSFAQRGIVRPQFIESLLRERLPEHPGYYGEMVWILMMLEQWMRVHAPDFRFR